MKKEFLQRVQLPHPLNPPDWVLIDSTMNIYEHADWINSEKLEWVLGDNMRTSTIHSSELRAKNAAEHVKIFLSVPDRFVAVIGDDQRFEFLVDRNVLLEQVAKRVAAEADGRSPI